MSEPTPTKRLVIVPNDNETPDGRRQRSERSRAQIVDALFALVRAGDMEPSAARVAEQAGVSLRTVFRHFEEMDSLYREMTARMEAEILPIVMKPFSASEWRGRLMEMVSRRAQIFEQIMPVRVAGNVRRFQSDYLMDDYRRATLMERSIVRGILPDAVLANEALTAALETATCFQHWRVLRQDLQLSPAAAEAAMRLMVQKLIDGVSAE